MFLPRLRLEEGGVVQSVLDLCEQLSSRGASITLMTWDATDFSGERTRLVVVPKPRRPFSSRTGGSGWDGGALREMEACDVLHLHTPWELGNVGLARAAMRLGKPVLLSTHGMLDDWSLRQKRLKKKSFLTLFKRPFFQRLAAVHCTAAEEERQVASHVPVPQRRFVVPLFVDLAALTGGSEAPVPAEGPRRLLFLSRIHPKKGIEFLIRAAGLLRRRGYSFALDIAGPGEAAYVDSLRRLAERVGVGTETRFLGMVRGEDKARLYRQAHAFVLPTYQENFGLVLVEALLAGLPVITTRGTDIWQELQEAGATIVEQEDTALADAVESVWAEPPDESRRDRTRERISNWLSPDPLFESYMAMYRSLIGNSLAAPPESALP